jgi:hypothetical protein
MAAINIKSKKHPGVIFRYIQLGNEYFCKVLKPVEGKRLLCCSSIQHISKESYQAAFNASKN